MSDLRVELLATPDCPHQEPTRAALHRVLSEGAIETPIQLVLVSTLDDAEFLGFPGSPTVRLNGEDLVPPPAGSPAKLACRLYVQPDGTLAGTIPEEVMLRLQTPPERPPPSVPERRGRPAPGGDRGSGARRGACCGIRSAVRAGP